MDRIRSRLARSGTRLAPCFFLAFGFALVSPAIAAPFKPHRPDQILERLPERIGAREDAGMAQLRARLRASPDDAEAAADLAERHYRIAQRRGDPRHVGYAQAVIAPWRDASSPPTEIRLVRSLLAQFLHDFAAARRDLDAVLAGDPANLAALSYRAVLAMVSANYHDAARDCDTLSKSGTGLVVEACRPTVDALSGKASAAYRALQGSLARHPTAPANERLWVQTRLGEIALRLGRSTEAEEYFRKAIALGIVDQLLLANYAEFLIDAGRSAEVIPLLKEHQDNDVLLLRLAVAEKETGATGASAHAALLAARFEANRLRGDKTHLADEAWFALVFDRDPKRAVALAAENWRLEQREPSDARILLETARAAATPEAAAPVLDWLAASGIEDGRLRRLARQLHEPAPAQGVAK